MTFSCLLKKRQTLVIKAIFARVCVCASGYYEKSCEGLP